MSCWILSLTIVWKRMSKSKTAQIYRSIICIAFFPQHFHKDSTIVYLNFSSKRIIYQYHLLFHEETLEKCVFSGVFAHYGGGAIDGWFKAPLHYHTIVLVQKWSYSSVTIVYKRVFYFIMSFKSYDMVCAASWWCAMVLLQRDVLELGVPQSVPFSSSSQSASWVSPWGNGNMGLVISWWHFTQCP